MVAVLGRPNVGKSTLVNRVLGRREAVVQERPGVTRDRREFRADWAGRDFILIDTGGWELASGVELTSGITAQAEAALVGADVVLLVVDGTVGLSEDDAAVANILRDTSATVILVANKVDDAARELLVPSLWKTGIGEPVPVSALHGRGIGDLLDRLVNALPEAEEVHEGRMPTLAIIGRPNVGKSTLLNRLTGEERVLVSSTPGTTRDPIDVEVTLGDAQYRVVDTAGIRRNPKVKDSADFYSIIRARQALDEADVALLLVDATEGVTQQDQRIAEEAAESGAGLILLLNKWDLPDLEQREVDDVRSGRPVGFCRVGAGASHLGLDRCPFAPVAAGAAGRPREPGPAHSHRPAQPVDSGVAGSPSASGPEGSTAQDPLRGPGWSQPAHDYPLHLRR